jgi:hypothetical protein
MGINRQVLKCLFAENQHIPIQGRVLFVGRSTITVSPLELDELLFEFAVDYRSTDARQRDILTRRSSSQYFIDDIELFRSAFPGITDVHVLDSSDYEGADVIINLNEPVPDANKNSYDFIFDSGVLDNVFNPAQMMMNMSLMLKANGRVCGFDMTSFYPGALCSCHPEWFYAFFAANGFSDAKVYLLQRTEFGMNNYEYPTRLWSYQPSFTRKADFSHFNAVNDSRGVFSTLYLAQLGSDALSSCQQPLNLHYLDSSEGVDWRLAKARFDASPRPLLGGCEILQPIPPRPHNTDHYLYLGENF